MMQASTMIRAYFLVVVCSCVLGFASRAQAETREVPLGESTVHIVPVDFLGGELEGLKVDRFESQSNGKNLANHFHGNTASGIPYGIYRARVYVLGFFAAERVVRVFQPKVTAVIGLSIGMEGGPHASDVSGRVQNVDRAGVPVRVRLVGIYSSTMVDAEVTRSGDFSFAEVPDGSYILIASQQERVLGVKAIKVPVGKLPILLQADDAKVVTPNPAGRPN